MPKPIKKKPVKQEQQQEDVQEIISRLATNAVARKRQIAIVGIAVLVALIIGGGAYLFSKDTAERAAYLEAEGYKLFNGQYEAATMQGTERLEKALASFRDANDTRSTAFRQYYIAATLYEMGQYEECLAALDEFDAKYSSNMRFIALSKLKRAMSYRKLGNNEQALSTLQEFNFISANTLKDSAIMQTAELLESMGREDEAQQYYTLLLREHQNSRFASIAQSRVKQPEPSAADSSAPMQQTGPSTVGSQQQGGQQPLQIELK